MIYLDTSYLVRLYLDEAGADKVRTLAATDRVTCSLHGRTELIAAFHRGYREGRYSRPAFLKLIDRFDEEEKLAAITWFPLEMAILLRAEKIYRTSSRTIFLRAADATHLACAAENGLRKIYSNDRHLLAAAPLFGLEPKNIIA